MPAALLPDTWYPLAPPPAHATRDNMEALFQTHDKEFLAGVIHRGVAVDGERGSISDVDVVRKVVRARVRRRYFVRVLHKPGAEYAGRVGGRGR